MSRKRIDGTKYRPRVKLYIALEDADFSWYPQDVEKVRRLWAEGKSVYQISKAFDNRDPDEVTLLIMDLARRQRISKRPGGAIGKSA